MPKPPPFPPPTKAPPKRCMNCLKTLPLHAVQRVWSNHPQLEDHARESYEHLVAEARCDHCNYINYISLPTSIGQLFGLPLGGGAVFFQQVCYRLAFKLPGLKLIAERRCFGELAVTNATAYGHRRDRSLLGLVVGPALLHVAGDLTHRVPPVRVGIGSVGLFEVLLDTPGDRLGVPQLTQLREPVMSRCGLALRGVGVVEKELFLLAAHREPLAELLPPRIPRRRGLRGPLSSLLVGLRLGHGRAAK